MKILGDVHLGRQFIRNVPLHRRGHRERMVWEQFEKELDPQGNAYHIQMGDLFDNDRVDIGIIARTARLYKKAAKDHPGARFIVLAGNHDLSRDLEFTSAFELFELIVGDTVTCVREPLLIDDMLFCGWSPTIPATELITKPARFTFGHWDVDLRSSPFNLIPTQKMKALGIEHAYTGHVHSPQEFERDGVQVHVVGSMQPYAHGEDATGAFYVTMTLDEIDAMDVKNKCVRIRLKPGEVFNREIDCLQLQIERVGEEVEQQLDVSLGDFDMQQLFNNVLDEFSIPATVRSKLETRWTKAFSVGA